MLPVGAQVLLALFAVDDYTGFEITTLLELPQPWSIIIVWGVVLPVVFLVASALTNFVLKDALILKVLAACLHWFSSRLPAASAS